MKETEGKTQSLHDYVKKNYENGNYSRDYSYHPNQRVNGQENSQDNASDYDRGVRQFYYDCEHGKVRHWHSYRLLFSFNKLLNGRLNEVTDFMEGYRAAFNEWKKLGH